ncbi:hypothetical protein AKJ37_02350 [candidate division MSBL1 archaeon SCGC-AAA259I09]|uniref:3-phosphoshikimate 1-carboxyvinyltransferase n=1 Tax=candidate division MSBL1 archaeon SCGC-AAA259I09 TaxID=1698267 RepID=A0A133UU87_9EURY|nr:hypothetical protein AKJ37_02350 [candidate division MSBL1 archaeon SCGC-AAA259I09]
MARLLVEPSEIGGRIEAQPSKSYTHRLLAISLLADGKSSISNPLLSLDTKATLEAIRFFGADVKNADGGWEVFGTGGDLKPYDKVINVRNSGTTLRFMTAISALSPESVRLTGDKSILRRPMGPLVESLSDLGVYVRCEGPSGRPPVVVGEGLVGGETRIVGTVSSQFVSGVLIVSPYSEVGVDLEVEEGLKSKPYVEMTLKTLEIAGAEIKSERSLMSYSIPGNQIFQPIDYTVPGDFSSAAFLLGAGALSERGVEVTNLDPDDVQGDKRIIELLKDFGAEVNVGRETVSVSSGGGLEGIDVDCSDTPDLVPVLAVLGAVAEGQTRLYNIAHLRFKEVDRIYALVRELKKLGVRVEESEDDLKIYGKGRLKGGELDSHGDHRMVMSLAIAGLVADDVVKIKGAESINVSYPRFVEDMRRLGAKVKVED